MICEISFMTQLLFLRAKHTFLKYTLLTDKKALFGFILYLSEFWCSATYRLTCFVNKALAADEVNLLVRQIVKRDRF